MSDELRTAPCINPMQKAKQKHTQAKVERHYALPSALNLNKCACMQAHAQAKATQLLADANAQKEAAARRQVSR